MSNQPKDLQNKLEEMITGNKKVDTKEFYVTVLKERLAQGLNGGEDHLVNLMNTLERPKDPTKLPTGTYPILERELSTPLYKVTLSSKELELLDQIIASSNFVTEPTQADEKLLVLQQQLESNVGGLQQVHTEYRLERADGETLSLNIMNDIYPKYSEERVQYFNMLTGIGLEIVQGDQRLSTTLRLEESEGGNLRYTTDVQVDGIEEEEGQEVTLDVFGDKDELLNDLQELVKDVFGDEEKETLGRHKEEMSRQLNVIEERIRNKE